MIITSIVAFISGSSSSNSANSGIIITITIIISTSSINKISLLLYQPFSSQFSILINLYLYTLQTLDLLVIAKYTYLFT